MPKPFPGSGSIKTSTGHVVKKKWGAEYIHHNDKDYCLKQLEIVHGALSSLHYHVKKIETFLIIYGTVVLEIGGAELIMTVGHSVTIPPGTPHRFRTATPRARIVEASTFHDDKDVVRIEESRLA